MTGHLLDRGKSELSTWLPRDTLRPLSKLEEMMKVIEVFFCLVMEQLIRNGREGSPGPGKRTFWLMQEGQTIRSVQTVPFAGKPSSCKPQRGGTSPGKTKVALGGRDRRSWEKTGNRGSAEGGTLGGAVYKRRHPISPGLISLNLAKCYTAFPPSNAQSDFNEG